MKPLDKWHPCLADADKGIAFFDLRPFSEETIRIEADPITEPRWDRVLPILEEEQVFMCRTMTPMLEELVRLRNKENAQKPADERTGLRVLDVGTGSGVFAICAAKLGCSVIAIDISPRALRFARHNALVNGISVTETDAPPRIGEIQLRQIALGDVDELASFDVVILAPPYNPTCKGFKPALHASAGPLGQKCFEEQLPLTARLLKSEGICIGNQMVVVDSMGQLQAGSLIASYFPDGEFRYTRIIESDITVRTFLESQYSTFLKKELGIIPTSAEVSTYIGGFPLDLHFALVYFEIRKSTGKKLESASCSFKEVTGKASPPQSWEDRTLLHRRIIEHTSLEDSFPAPALFLEIDALPDFPVTKSARNRAEEGWNASVLRYIDSWLAKTELLHPKKGLFDLLCVDTAPWYPTTSGRRGLLQESAAWVAPGYVPEVSKRFLACYQDNTVRLQQTMIGPFLHPHFTGQNNPNEWRGIQFTVREPESCSAKLMKREYAPLLDEMAQSLNEINTPRSPKFEDRIEYSPSLVDCKRTVYTHTPLNNLEVPAERLREVDAAVRQRIRRLRSLSSIYQGSEESALYPVDLDLCHRAMHRRLDLLAKESGIIPKGSSSLVGVPVSMASPQTSTSPNKLPDNYRGGIWLYAVFRGAWTPEAERYLLDLARLLSMLYEAQYSERAATELEQVGRDEATSAIFHQIPKDFGALEKCLKNLRIEAENADATVSSLRSLIPDTDAMAFMIMAADAAVQRPSYQLLPSDLPPALEERVTSELVSSIMARLVIPYVGQRVNRDDVLKCEEYKQAWLNLKPTEFDCRFPIPATESFSEFAVPSGRDLYIWLILALRSAAYHAYYPLVAGQTSEQGKIVINYHYNERTLVVSNTGNAPDTESTQIGWKRDLEVFMRPGQAWKVVEQKPGCYSCWNPALNRWETKIANLKL